MRSWADVEHLLSSVSRSSAGFSTNLYAAPEQVQRWCEAATLSAHCADGVVLFVRADRDFLRVYHWAANPGDLAAGLRALDLGTFVVDLIGNEAQLAGIAAAYGSAGFAEHSTLQRMVRLQAPAPAGPGEASVASPADAPAIAALLERLLDPYVEQLPGADELARAAAAGQVLIARHDNALAGMLMYDLKGQSAHLRFWHVDDNARGKGVGRGLMTSFLARCAGARRIILWVIGDNARSISIYRHYGFTSDVLLDRIMIMHKEQGS